ncbi:L-2-amino-thiazoline-4-carboxylic acid hydrolase [Ruminococcaceae bacterium YRB3002]|nr:L-2-amino-thiazoline-4-carboxylic acid hydrolase [Ruminococcaceae bacterium YRB3002]
MDQNKQIRKWLKETIDLSDAERIATSQVSIFKECVDSIHGKTANQIKTLTKTILPRVALYKALKNDPLLSDRAYELVRKYMIEVIGRQKHESTAILDKIPGFYRMYSKSFLRIMRTTDLQVSTQQEGKDHYDITITSCLWYNACVEHGCPELCRAFCEVDDITYGGLTKLGFTRTQTLGTGGECCDFHFYRK